ncbi:hypothetical protein AAHC03_013497 [Spirometra sp. Aus1]
MRGKAADLPTSTDRSSDLALVGLVIHAILKKIHGGTTHSTENRLSQSISNHFLVRPTNRSEPQAKSASSTILLSIDVSNKPTGNENGSSS